jgi:hypothetical protein
MPSDNPLQDALAEFLKSPQASPSIHPAPALKRSSTSLAIKRCRAAWQRAFDATFDEEMNKGTNQCFAESNAAGAGGKAYCNAMPLLSGYDSICDFVACVAHGILIEAVPTERSGQLLYAAQVALSTISRAPKPLKVSAPRPVPTPGGRKKRGK